MKYYSYASNIYSTDEEFKNCIVILAINKKEAQKWSKQFPGLIIGNKIKTKVKEFEESSEIVMNIQTHTLGDSLSRGKLYIKTEEEEI